MMTFKSGAEMLGELQNNSDLYNAEKELYAFVYNDAGSICVYDIDNEEAKELKAKSAESGDYWGAFLGAGGSIYDDPSYEDYDEDLTSNLEWCNDNLSGEWEVVGSF